MLGPGKGWENGRGWRALGDSVGFGRWLLGAILGGEVGVSVGAWGGVWGRFSVQTSPSTENPGRLGLSVSCTMLLLCS